MKTIYNKGNFRSGEWGKHLRPFLKKLNNRKWRRTAANLTPESGLIKEAPLFKSKRKPKKSIEVKFKFKIGDFTHSSKVKYRSLRAAKDAMKRNSVIFARILN